MTPKFRTEFGPPCRPHSFAREFERIRSSRIRSENETASLHQVLVTPCEPVPSCLRPGPGVVSYTPEHSSLLERGHQGGFDVCLRVCVRACDAPAIPRRLAPFLILIGVGTAMLSPLMALAAAFTPHSLPRVSVVSGVADIHHKIASTPRMMMPATTILTDTAAAAATECALLSCSRRAPPPATQLRASRAAACHSALPVVSRHRRPRVGERSAAISGEPRFYHRHPCRHCFAARDQRDSISHREAGDG